ncbi:hypothetical protein [Micromonospora endolithica]|uniref:hypothetical protein n=1 Tax=Micromonospora endolithica TaxID=230091 RepID=UPI0011BDE93C|nr:hypothetical protein [Micromonospora endolithica]
MAWEWLGPTATAVVGVAGITGTVVAAALTRRAQVEAARIAPAHSLLADKRVLYAKFLRSAEDQKDSALKLSKIRLQLQEFRTEVEAFEDSAQEPPQSLVERVERLVQEVSDVDVQIRSHEGELRRLSAEIAVVGGRELHGGTEKVRAAYADWITEKGGTLQSASHALRELAALMHQDVKPH